MNAPLPPAAAPLLQRLVDWLKAQPEVQSAEATDEVAVALCDDFDLVTIVEHALAEPAVTSTAQEHA